MSSFTRSRLHAAGAILALASASVATAQSPQAVEQHARLLKAMGRDFGISEERATQRLTAERIAMDTHGRLRAALGKSFAGAWFDAEEMRLVVATTDAKGAKIAEANGSRATLVARSLAQLDQIQGKLDRTALQMSAGQKSRIWMWGVDFKANTVAITVPAGDPQALIDVSDFLVQAGVDPRSVRIDQSQLGRPTPFTNIRGGDQIRNVTDGNYCSIGFAVTGGFVTAGHCSNGTVGDVVQDYLGSTMGTFAGSTYPGEDRAWVQTYSGWIPVACVGNGSTLCTTSENVLVNGSIEAPVGSSVCRWERLSGDPWCGVIQQTNMTVNLPVTVNHLVLTDVCSKEGESGGPFMSGNQAQGMMSVGPLNSVCPFGVPPPVGKWSAYYPVNLALSAFGLTLTVAPGVAPPTPGNFHVTYTYSAAKYRFTASWSASATATSYVLAGHVYSGPSTSVSWTVPENWEDLSIDYSVRACNANGCSMPAGPVQATWQ